MRPVDYIEIPSPQDNSARQEFDNWAEKVGFYIKGGRFNEVGLIIPRDGEKDQFGLPSWYLVKEIDGTFQALSPVDFEDAYMPSTRYVI